jgi:hypothetical protein
LNVWNEELARKLHQSAVNEELTKKLHQRAKFSGQFFIKAL